MPLRNGVPQLSQLATKPYNNVRPYDSNFFWDVLRNSDYRNNGYKFVSWKDFDKALDADQILHNKLISLNGDGEYSDAVEFDENADLFNVIPLSTNRNSNRIFDNFLYETDEHNGGKHLNNV